MSGYSPIHDLVFPSLFERNKPIETISDIEGLHYSFEKQDQVVIVRTPVHVESLRGFFDALKKRVDLAQTHVLLGVVGQGATEKHIVTMHLPPNKQPIVYDSKDSNPERFFSLPKSKNSIGGIMSAIWHTLNPFASPDQTVNLSHLGIEQIQSATYHALGTQSFFDGITCGYHTANLIKTLADYLSTGDNPPPEDLADLSKNPVTNSAQILRKGSPTLVDVSFFSFLKKAWQDTFLPLVNEDERDDYHFGHYFMGWPSQAKGSKIAYVITLKFITSPLTNLLSLVIEFPLNVLSETFSFLKNGLLSWAPTNGITQGMRSVLLLAAMGLQGLFKGANYLVRTITSPMTSFKAAHKIHPALGYLSALASVCFIGAIITTLAIFAPPIVAALIPHMGPGAISMLNLLAYPFVQLFSLLSVSISAATGTALTFAIGALSLGVLHMLGRKTIYPENNEPVEQSKSSLIPPSNVAVHFERTESSNEVGDDFTMLDEPNISGPGRTSTSGPGLKLFLKTEEISGSNSGPQYTIDKDLRFQ
ncbi:Uncharacterised protein [Legionella steigerwaltii]|uniref:Uncharacterized protein n=1 Tax=Legionella steigerwaltii TaxID=460 RepID=A0A378LBM2_9GAMM|nr:hypothetical protein [Legionella steigerwaltii]KTD69811.1 hypothetical protein Lstg_3430 [Legionella steigerwaltii]STY21471.1 Uncharacterised protein [Legionella steigerwaltii]